MKQIPQFPTIKCETHPEANISSISVEQKRPYKSRLACMKCLKEYKTMDNFIEINELVFAESVITSFQDINGSNKQLANYLIEALQSLYSEQSQQLRRQTIDNFIQQLHKKVDELKTCLIEQLNNQKEYLRKIAELRTQYDAELINLQSKLQSVSQLTNYHKTEEWVELQKCVESYVQLFYQPENQEIKVTLQGLNALIPKRFNTQSINECKVWIENQIAQICKQLNFNSYSIYMLDSSIFGNSIIDRITDKGKKSMKLLFSGQRDGMNPAAFWKNCLNMGPTITICESKSGQIFGGYTPCKWIANNNNQQDASMTSFLFSVTKQQIYPLKKKDYAIYGKSIYGPFFGSSNDLYIAPDFQTYSSNLGTHYDTSQYQIADPKTHLLGASSATLKSIEVYLIE